MAALAVAVPLGLVALSGCTAVVSQETGSAKDAKYGSLPSYLPKDSIVNDSVLTGTAGNPAITSEGDSITAKFAGGTARISVVGPEVPGEGLPYQTDSTTCTWTVTITDVSGTVPVSPKDFSSIDHLGAIYRPTFVAGQPVPSATLVAGQKATFELRAVMEVGEGLMRWAPDGKHIVGSWDFEVEND